MIRLTTLGGFAVEKEGGETPAPQAHGKRNALLAYLAVERPSGNSHPRDTLLALLWPDSDDRHARDALKQLVRSLRQDLGQRVIVRIRGNGLALNEDLVWCDVAELLEAAERSDHARVMELYCGDFMAGFHLGESNAFEEWIAKWHRRLLELTVQAGKSLTEALEAGGDRPSAIRMIRRVRELRPFDEGALRTLVRLYLEEGEHGGAVRAYNEYEERLSRELSASPSAETVALVEWARARVVVRDDPAVVEVGVPEFKTRGLGRPSSRRSGRGLAAAALLTGVAGLAAFAWAQVNASAPLPLEESRVLVSAFENRTGGADLDALGRAVVDRLAGGLTEISFITVATDAEHSESGGAIRGASGADPVRLARELGAGVLVTGSFTASEDEVVFDARLVDVASGEVVAGGLRQNAPLADPGEALERLTDRVMAEVGARVDPRLASWSRHSSRPGTYEAYLTFVEALDEHVLRSRWARARELFLGLYEADTTFTMAALWGGMAAVNMGDAAFRDSLYAALDRRRSVLAPVDRYFLEGETSRRSRTRRLDAYRRLMDVAPGSDYATFASSAAFQAQRPSEAIAFLEAADLTRGWIWALAPWNGWAAALEALGRCAEIPELADRGQATMPARYADLYAEEMRLIAFACLGDTERFLEAARGMTAAVELSNLTGAWQGEIIAQHAQRLVTSGISDAERSEITEFVSEYMVERLHVRPLTPFRFSEFLATVGLEDSARVVLDRVRDEDGSWPWGEPAALRAIIEQRAGNEALADRLMEVVVRDERYGSPTWCDLCEAVLAGHRGELERAMDLVREEGLPSGAGWWEARSRPYFYGPLLDHPPFQEFIAPRG